MHEYQINRMVINIKQTTCKQCGLCCKQGGPALHLQDLALVKSGKIPINRLITIRKGELVDNPLVGKIVPTTVELVKIIGNNGQWECCFHDAKFGCTVYTERPLACRVLKCWDTAEILELVEKDTLSRFDIVDKNDPILGHIIDHEQICPCHDLGDLWTNVARLSDDRKKELEQRVRRDLDFRGKILGVMGFTVSEELFYFGRPLFQLLQPLGLQLSESPGGIRLTWHT